jgi:CubicO group peptidase (beta-lactamase class C family)
LIAAWLGPFAHAAPSPDASEAARARAVDVLALLRAPDAGRIRSYVTDHFSAAGDALNQLAALADQTRGIDGPEVEVAGDEVTVRGVAALTEQPVAFRVRVEATPPFRVQSLSPARATPPTDAPGRRMSDEALAGEVDRYVHKLAAADAFSGVVLIAVGDQPVLVTAVGQASREFEVPNRPDTRFNLGSVTKTFTAVSVLQLAERGKLSLDDPLSKYLPDVPGAESADRITIRQLLTHTSGLGDHVNAMARDPFRTRYRTVGSMLELVRGVPPMFEPGSRWRYSNSGYLVLGAVIEKASGRDYYDYVRENVFARAGMGDTDFDELDRVNHGRATGYTKEFRAGRPLFRNNQFDLFVRGGPEGGAYSTAHDLLRFARALRGGKLLSPRLVDEALSAKPGLGSPGYGYGFEVEEGGRVVGHGGSFVGAQTKLDLFPTGDYTAVVLSNLSQAARPVVAKVRSLVLANGSGSQK